MERQLDRREFFIRAGRAAISTSIALRVTEAFIATVATGFLADATKRVARAAERFFLIDKTITDPRVDVQHPFVTLQGWPDAVNGTHQGTLSKFQDVGLEEFFSTEANGGSPLPELSWLKVRDIPLNEKGEYEIPDNTGFTFQDISVNSQTGRTELIWLRLRPGRILFISAGEIELHAMATKFSMDNGEDGAVAKFLQIDAQPGQPANPHGNNIYIIAGSDPLIGVRLAVPGNAVAIQYQDKYGKRLVDQEQLSGQASLDRSTKDTVVTAMRMEDGAWGMWVFNHGPKANNDQERRNVPDGVFQPVVTNVK